MFIVITDHRHAYGLTEVRNVLDPEFVAVAAPRHGGVVAFTSPELADKLARELTQRRRSPGGPRPADECGGFTYRLGGPSTTALADAGSLLGVAELAYQGAPVGVATRWCAVSLMPVEAAVADPA